jgi:beta-fructofuranosidase
LSGIEPKLHIRPEFGWLNDPNGPFWWKNRWHVFFQHNPAGPRHDNIHWAHVSSTDLLSWRSDPIALRPRPGRPDAAGCWSGCVTVDHGVPVAVYTGVADSTDPGTICLAYGDDDLRTWQQLDKPVATLPAGVTQMRDPFVFHHAGSRWAIVGATLDDGRAAALLFSCDDLRDWIPCGTLATSSDGEAANLPPADIWECPQLVEVDGEWVLIVSLWRAHQLTGVGYLVGALVEDTAGLRFEATASGLVDAGRDFYAPALLSDSTSTRGLLWGWSWEARPDAAVTESGWAGLLTLPRQLRLAGDLLLTTPATEGESLRTTRLIDGAALTADSALDLPSSTIDVEIRMPTDFDGAVVLTDPSGTDLLELHATWSVEGGSLRWRGAVASIAHTHSSPRPDEDVTLRLMLDRTVVEAYCSHHTTATARSAALLDGPWQLRSYPIAPAAAPQVDAWSLELPAHGNDRTAPPTRTTDRHQRAGAGKDHS